jgi:hypothetical protein
MKMAFATEIASITNAGKYERSMRRAPVSAVSL